GSEREGDDAAIAGAAAEIVSADPALRQRATREKGRQFSISPSRRSLSPQRITAVDDESRAGHVARGVTGEIEGERAEVLGLAEVAERNLGPESRDHFGMQLRPALVGLGHEAAR